MLPLLPLSPLQRLAWIDRPVSLRCLTSLPISHLPSPIFVPGQSYTFLPEWLDLSWIEHRTDLSGRPVPFELTGQEMAFRWVGDRRPEMEDGGRTSISDLRSPISDLRSPILFRENRFGPPEPGDLPLHLLADHFEIPEVPHRGSEFADRSSQIGPELPSPISEFTAALARVDALAAQFAQRLPGFAWRWFQREDLARLTMGQGENRGWKREDGEADPSSILPLPSSILPLPSSILPLPSSLSCVLAYDCGLGKTLMALAWFLLGRWKIEDRRSGPNSELQTPISHLPSPISETPRCLILAPAGLRDRWAEELTTATGWTLAREDADRRWKIEDGKPDPSSILHSPSSPQPFTFLSWSALSRLPPSHLALLNSQFTHVIADEAVRLKGQDSLVGAAARALTIPHRLALTGTPLKNKLADLFPLCEWVTQGEDRRSKIEDGGSKRERKNEDRGSKMEDRKANPSSTLHSPSSPLPSSILHPPSSSFLVRETNLETGATRLTDRVQNLPALWKYLAPVVLRRSKQNLTRQESEVRSQKPGAGIPNSDSRLLSSSSCLVRKHIHTLTVPFSPEQQQETDHLLATQSAFRARPHLRNVTLGQGRGERGEGRSRGPHAPSRVPFRALAERSQPPIAGPSSILHPLSSSSPKLTAALELIQQFTREQKATLVFSPFTAALDALSDLLHQARIPHEVADGRLSPDQRATLAQNFQGAKDRRQKSEVRSQKSGEVRGAHAPSRVPFRALAERFPVLLATYDSMAEGYNFPRCSRIIALGLPDPLDKLLQAEDRGWRLDSVEDLHVWRIECAHSIDARLRERTQEKHTTAALVLDAQF